MLVLVQNINTILPLDIDLEKSIEVVKETSLPSFLDITDEYEDYKDILSGLSFEVTEIGKANSIGYSSFESNTIYILVKPILYTFLLT